MGEDAVGWFVVGGNVEGCIVGGHLIAGCVVGGGVVLVHCSHATCPETNILL